MKHLSHMGGSNPPTPCGCATAANSVNFLELTVQHVKACKG